MSVASTSAILFQSQRGYDAASNVTSVATTLTAGTDNQVFCYDDENRLVWAGSTGTPSCGTSLTAGSLGSANYTQTFTYDNLDRLTSGPLGNYAYGDSAHLHAVTSIGSGPTYTAKYDAVGDMTCRAPDNTTTCAGTPTGAQLGYDNEGRLATWQNAPSSPTTSDSFLYDGAGNRIEQSVTINGSMTTTTTYVAGGLEEISDNGTGSTLTKYFTAGNGLPTAERVGTSGPLSYLATDGQGTVSQSLDSAGNVTSSQLYTPYGNARYSSGSSPTSMGYTGQRADGATGLDYYSARYYDPVAGQFVSADTVADGLSRYGYVGGNPETATDPSGHYQCFDDSCARGGVGSSGSGSGSGSGSSGGKGCGGNQQCSPGSPGSQDPCAKPPSEYYAACYAQWEDTNKQKRFDALTLTRVIAYGTHGLGLVLSMLADVAIFMTKGSAVPALMAWLDFAFDTLSLADDVANAISDAAMIAAVGWMTGVVHAVIGIVRGAIALYKQWGPLGEAAADAAVITMKAGFGGLPSVLTTIIMMLAGVMANNLLSAGGHFVIALGAALIWDYQRQMSEDIGVWCSESQNKGVCTTPPVNPNPI